MFSSIVSYFLHFSPETLLNNLLPQHHDLIPIPLAVTVTCSAAPSRKICAGPASRPSHCTATVQKTLHETRSSSWWIADSSERSRLHGVQGMVSGSRVTTTTTSCRCLRFPLRGIVQAGTPPQEMVGKCINKTKDNKDKPVCPCEALCGAAWDPAGSQPLPGISDGFGPVLRLCGGRKKKLDKGLGSLPQLSPGTSARSAGSFKGPRS